MTSKDAARRMLADRPQCSQDDEADDTFAMLVGEQVLTVADEKRVHRGRVRALADLVRRGEVDAHWVGIPLDATWHGARRARIYTALTTATG